MRRDARSDLGKKIFAFFFVVFHETINRKKVPIFILYLKINYS